MESDRRAAWSVCSQSRMISGTASFSRTEFIAPVGLGIGHGDEPVQADKGAEHVLIDILEQIVPNVGPQRYGVLEVLNRDHGARRCNDAGSTGHRSRVRAQDAPHDSEEGLLSAPTGRHVSRYDIL